ncbi:MAG: aspartate--ammonia ligase [Elusimicrobia bacterium RIFOXYA2_FULL_58_8]|nr:MAG: aspartate--ammonia ligase [Elusimicrobia bacterium RIFOXYA2_FULL_58_8]
MKYKSILSLRETERAIKFIKDSFQVNLARALRLERVSAPLFVRGGSGVNDDLNGSERKVSFSIKHDKSAAEVVFSLAKWKRMVLADYKFRAGEGLYTDMNAIRPDEERLDNIHSVYVDQWDWEKIITRKQRGLPFLKVAVRKIYAAMKATEHAVHAKYPAIRPQLPAAITFIHSEDLAGQYPALEPREREYQAAKKYGAVFIIGIGGALAGGQPHDGRAPDYDDWTTPTGGRRKGLNGDIFVWYQPLQTALEISSMGIRVDRAALLRQLKVRHALKRKNLFWHKRLLNNRLPLTIGGGIGQSRLCMLFLKKLHIGEVHASVWPQDVRAECAKAGIRLL